MIWCVEDDKSILDIEIYTLRVAGFETRGFSDGRSFWKALQLEVPELILLDIMLPDDDGVSLLEKLKDRSDTQDIPVIMTTAKGQEYDKIQSLDLGADDYLVKPFGMMEMVSRIKAVLRRCGKGRENKPEQILKIEGLVMNLNERTVFADGEEVILTFKEFEILHMFLSQPRIVFTRDKLFAQVWGENFMGESRTVDMHIKTLRQKLGKYGEIIQTVRNVGYKLEVR